MEKMNVTREEEIAKVEQYLDKSYILFGYYDGCNVDDGSHFAEVETYLRNANITPMYEVFEDYINRVRTERVGELLKDIRHDMEMNGDGDLYMDYLEYIVETIYERDESDDLWDIIDTRRKYTFFYDLGVSVPCWDDVDDEERARVYDKMASRLGLVRGSHKAEQFLYSLWSNAYDGGDLRLYFNASMEDLMEWNIKSMILDGWTYVGIVNSILGSGCVDDFNFDMVRMPFNRKHLYVSEADHYNWEEIAGTYSGWAEEITFSTEPAVMRKQESQYALGLYVKQETTVTEEETV